MISVYVFLQGVTAATLEASYYVIQLCWLCLRLFLSKLSFFLTITSINMTEKPKEPYRFRPLVLTKLDTKSSQNGWQPIARSGHRLVCHDGRLYSFGGYNPASVARCGPLFRELWCLNLSTSEWTELTCSGSIPHTVASHTMVRQHNTLIVFGGTGMPFGEVCSDEVNVCSINKLEWRVIHVTGNKPDKLYGQASCLTKDYLYIVGGTNGFEYFLNVHRLDVHRGVWECLSASQDCARPRYRHEIAVYKDNVYVVGGGTATSSYPLKRMPVFNTKTLQWDYINTRRDEEYGYPAARRCHALVQKDEVFYISGGRGESILDDIWMFHLQERSWKKLPVVLPEPVYFHSMDIFQGCLYMFGGVKDISSDKRTDSVWKCWLDVPSLQSMCWDALNYYFPNIQNTSPDELLQIGVPLQQVRCLFQPEVS